MNIPKLEENKCSVLIAEYATGCIYKNDFSLFQTGNNENDAFQIFNEFSLAEKFTLELIEEKPQFECSIFDFNGIHLVTYDLNGIKYNRSKND